MREIGVSADCTTAARCAKAFAALHALHAAGFVHGDARLPNLLRTGARLVWADLRLSLAADGGRMADAQRFDAVTLAASVLRAWGLSSDELALPAAVGAATRSIPDEGAPAYAALAGAVWASRA